MDALIVGGSLYRPARFVMWYRIFDIPLLRFLFRTARAIPIAAASEDPELLSAAFDRIDAELAAGNLVCIFPEGQITHDGHMNEFRPGVEKILARRPVPVIPIALSGLWGSWFSRLKGGRLRRLPGKLFARVDVRFGEAVPARDASAAGLEMLVRTLRGRTR
jgi:1-acyl-sn-glycerol-3-phosphate acyltransferase